MPAWMGGVGAAFTGLGNDLRSWNDMRRQEEERKMQMRLQGIFPVGEEPVRQEQYREFVGPGVTAPPLPQAPTSPAELARLAASARGANVPLADRARETLSPGAPTIPQSLRSQAPVPDPNIGTRGPMTPRDLAAASVGLRPEFVTRTREAPYQNRIPVGKMGGQEQVYIPEMSAAGIQSAQEHERARERAREEAGMRTEGQLRVTERGAELNREQVDREYDRNNRAGYALMLAEDMVQGEYDPNQNYTTAKEQVDAALERRRQDLVLEGDRLRAGGSRSGEPQTFEEFLDQMGTVYMRAYTGTMSPYASDPDAASDEVFKTVAEQWLKLHPEDARVEAMLAPPAETAPDPVVEEERRGFVEGLKSFFGGLVGSIGEAGTPGQQGPAERGEQPRSADEWLQYFESIGVPRRKQADELRKRATQGLVTDADSIAGR